MNKNSYYRYVAVIMIILILYTFLSSLHDALGTGFIYLLKFFFLCGPFLKSLLNFLQYCM